MGNLIVRLVEDWSSEHPYTSIINHENNFIIILAVTHRWQCDLGDLIGEAKLAGQQKPCLKSKLYIGIVTLRPAFTHSFCLISIGIQSPSSICWDLVFDAVCQVSDSHCLKTNYILSIITVFIWAYCLQHHFWKLPRTPPPFPQVWSFFQKDNYNVMFVGNFLATIGHVYPF